MSNSGELAAAREAKERPKVLVMGADLMAGLELASVMGMASSVIHPSMLGSFLSKTKTRPRHEPHQGDKERQRRLKHMKMEKS
jgi:hypothetical protein